MNHKTVPIVFFAVHFEPRSADDTQFDSLIRLVNGADSFNIKLTLQFTPSWAKMILNDDRKLTLIRQWQNNGHEVAAHHHGPYHDWG